MMAHRNQYSENDCYLSLLHTLLIFTFRQASETVVVYILHNVGPESLFLFFNHMSLAIQTTFIFIFHFCQVFVWD